MVMCMRTAGLRVCVLRTGRAFGCPAAEQENDSHRHEATDDGAHDDVLDHDFLLISVSGAFRSDALGDAQQEDG
jgi:hypothetical protein